MTALVCGENARHYEVLSADEVILHQGYMEPTEYGRCWGYYLARNRRDARLQAIRSAEFLEWADEMRASGKPPMAGLEVKPFVCPHGVCVGCFEEGKGCEACDSEAETDPLNADRAGAVVSDRPMPKFPRLEPIRLPEAAKAKRTEPIVIDGMWYGPNACRQCEKWYPPYKGAVPTEIADEYCWGHDGH